MHRNPLSFPERREKHSLNKYAINHRILLSDENLSTAGSESDMTMDHVTHSRELDINTRSPAMKLRTSAEGRDEC